MPAKRQHRSDPVTSSRRSAPNSKRWPTTSPLPNRQPMKHSEPTSVSMLNAAFRQERTNLVRRIRGRFRLDESTSADIVHDAYLSCLIAMQGVAMEVIGEPQALSVLRTAAHRKGIDYLRYCKRDYVGATNQGEALNAQPQQRPEALDRLIRAECVRRIAQSLKALAASERAVLHSRVIERQPRKQVAELMGCCERTVTSKTRRALERLRQIIEGYGE